MFIVPRKKSLWQSEPRRKIQRPAKKKQKNEGEMRRTQEGIREIKKRIKNVGTAASAVPSSTARSCGL
jgi:hypothetical protein